MQPQIITVFGIEKSIQDVGIGPYANTLVQDMAEGGKYFYVDVDESDKHRIVEIPLFLAWFIIDALRLKAECSRLGDNEYEHAQGIAVYLVPGSEIMGQKVDRLTEIPAEVRPVILDRL